MILMSYFQFYFFCDFASSVKTSINIYGSSWSSKWGSGDIKSFNELMVDEIFSGTAVH